MDRRHQLETKSITIVPKPLTVSLSPFVGCLMFPGVANVAVGVANGGVGVAKVEVVGLAGAEGGGGSYKDGGGEEGGIT